MNSVFDEKLGKVKDAKAPVSQEQWDFYADLDRVMEEYGFLLEQHIDRRIQLFFMQLICTWNTPYHFEWVEANDQYGKGGNHALKTENGQKQVFQTEGAHSSTLPCLVAYPRDEWESFERGEQNKPEGFVYLKYGHDYLQQNGTVELARFVNRADILVDGTHQDSRLRNEAIKIVNAVASGEYGPKEGMTRFIRQFEAFVERGKQNCNPDDPRLRALECYEERIDEVKDEMIGDEGYFDQLLGVKVAEHQKEAVLRDVVYRNRFSLIQKCEDVESRIARDILDAQNRMLKTRKRSLKSVDYRLRYVLLEDMDPVFRRTLERLFCTSLEQLQTGVEKNEERLRAFEAKAKIRSFRQNHAAEIRRLKGTLRERFRELDTEELNFRSALLKGLRWDLNKWYQRELVAEYAERFPLDSMSKSMVSRMEQRARPSYDWQVYLSPLSQRRKDIDEGRAKKLADTLGVDRGLLLPGIVSSVY